MLKCSCLQRKQKQNMDLVMLYCYWPCFPIENLPLAVTNPAECSLLIIPITEASVLDLVVLNVCSVWAIIRYSAVSGLLGLAVGQILGPIPLLQEWRLHSSAAYGLMP